MTLVQRLISYQSCGVLQCEKCCYLLTKAIKKFQVVLILEYFQCKFDLFGYETETLRYD